MQKDQTGRLDESVGSFGTIVLTIKWGYASSLPIYAIAGVSQAGSIRHINN